MDNILLKEALKYAGKGFYVFPCREKYEGKYYSKKFGKWREADAKQPRVSGGLNNATIDSNIIREWWSRSGWENSCIAINCGLSKLFVIDMDVHNINGMNNFNKLAIPDIDAWHSSTANGGMHIVFSDPKGIGKSSTNSRLGIDTRGRGGYFIAPPSCIYEKDGTKKCYIALDDWDRKLQEISPDSMKKLGIDREQTVIKKDGPDLPKAQHIIRIKKALDRIPSYMCDEYSDWLSIGMALYSLGNDGLFLWREWSKKSSKYTEGICEEKWETFKPNQISLGTIFYKARSQNV